MSARDVPARKKIKTTDGAAVSAFFTKASEKPKTPLKWKTRGSLIVGDYRPSQDKVCDAETQTLAKIAAFDLDGTLITTQSGSSFARSETDWKFSSSKVIAKIRQLHSDGYTVVIFSNQAGIKMAEDAKRYPQFRSKLEAICDCFKIPVLIYAATGHDQYRKPRSGMWSEMLRDLPNITSSMGATNDELRSTAVTIDHELSFFVGDAAGRPKGFSTMKDFSASDLKFALNLDLAFFTPESFFSDAPLAFRVTESTISGFNPMTFQNPAVSEQYFERTNPQDLILFVGSPAAGKSTYYRTFLEPMTYVRVNQDTLKTRQKCLKAAEEELKNGNSVCVDNTNADISTRKCWIELAATFKLPVRCLHFNASTELAEHNNMVRAYGTLREGEEERTVLPKMAFTSFAQRYQEPTMEEGFQDIQKVEFILDDDRPDWRKFWL